MPTAGLLFICNQNLDRSDLTKTSSFSSTPNNNFDRHRHRRRRPTVIITTHPANFFLLRYQSNPLFLSLVTSDLRRRCSVMETRSIL
ncbi:unnamed protein product [Lactuca virosa]|uniref:Uncharacterized protein n=1 Tax=Lactuca virosa TaxID=75947 RepID=A0AAU9LA61_9ASTR|nr:unnamed protein product [Lactuca virosa]